MGRSTGANFFLGSICVWGLLGVPFAVASKTIERESEKLSSLYPISQPQLKISIPKELRTCLKDLANETAILTAASDWSLTCDISILLKRANQLRTKNEALRLLIGRVIHSELIKMRIGFLDPGHIALQQLLDNENELSSSSSSSQSHQVSDSKVEIAPLSKILKKLPQESSEQGRTVPLLVNTENIALFIKASEPLVKSAKAWLRPLYISSSKKNSLLAFEGAYAFSLILGDSLRFNELRSFIKSNKDLVFNRRAIRGELIKKVVAWSADFSDDPLRQWVVEEMTQLRNSDVKGSGGLELYYWLKSFELAGAPSDQQSRDFILEKLRELAISYPNLEDQNEILRVAGKLGYRSRFKLPASKDLNVRELLLRARAQIRFLDTVGALRTMKRVKRLPSEEVSNDELWAALEYHVKVLRLLDERRQIPAVLKSYMASGKFLDNPPTDKLLLQKYLKRAQLLARMYWNYDTQEKALAVVKKIEDLNKKHSTDYSLGPALVIKARIAEQSRDMERERAIQLMDQALNSKISKDLMIDLMWRKIFLQIDLNRLSGNFDEVLPLFEPLKKFSEKDSFEKARLSYWMGKIYLLRKDKPKATQFFKEAYSAESFSYYGNLAGLELSHLGDSPKGWSLNKKDSPVVYEQRQIQAPNFDLFFDSNGKVTAPIYKSLARVFLLASIGDLRGAENAFPDLDRDLWGRVLSSRVSWSRRHEYARAVAFIRLALGDPMGALRASDVAKQANPRALELEDYLNLYPLPYWSQITLEAQKKSIDPWLVASLIRQESAFNPRARSWANAIGLMQMIPPVAEQEAKSLGWYAFEVESLYDPATAITMGSNHLSGLLEHFDNSWICSVAAYNAGKPPVKKWISFYNNDLPLTFVERIPFVETRNYVKSIIRNYINYHRIYGEHDISLDEIMKMPKGVPGSAVAKTPNKK